MKLTTIASVMAQSARRNMFRGCVALSLVIGSMTLTSAEIVCSSLVRTRVDGHRVCSATGRWLQFGPADAGLLRAWVGVLTDDTGGPARSLIRQRQQLSIQRALQVQNLQPDDDSTLAQRELQARRRQLRCDPPRHFDAVLLEYTSDVRAGKRFCWIVDYDIDGDLNDESVTVTETPASASDEGLSRPAEVFRNLSLSVRFGGPDRRPILRFQPAPAPDGREPDDDGPAVIKPETQQPEESAAVPATAGPAGSVPSESSPDSTPDAVPEGVAGLVAQLHQLDTPQTRKQHLERIVTLAGAIIDLCDADAATPRALLADTLYRQGRALGYMELPDVVARTPVKDPAALQQRFEATFRRLEQLVDTTAPDYILLRIRRERRRNCRGLALELVDVYRTTHPQPIWHYRKRFDLLMELGAEFHAHQAAADMWLRSRHPGRLVPVLVRRRVDEPGDNSLITGSWRPLPPFRDRCLQVSAMPNGDLEEVVWLEEGREFTITGVSPERVWRQFRVQAPVTVLDLRSTTRK